MTVKVVTHILLVSMAITVAVGCDKSRKNSSSAPLPQSTPPPPPQNNIPNGSEGIINVVPKIPITYVIWTKAHYRVIFETRSTQEIIEKVHRVVVCGNDSNVKSVTTVQGFVRVQCRQSIWGEKLEAHLAADVEAFTRYDLENRKFEQNRSLSWLALRPGKVLVIGSDMGVDDPDSTVGIASHIANHRDDPSQYRMKESVVLRDNDSGKDFSVTNIAGVRISFADFFSIAPNISGKAARITQHELGHLMGLFHTFQFASSAENDLVGDTPSHMPDDCQPVGIRENIMSYCSREETTFSVFTPGQIERMNQIAL